MKKNIILITGGGRGIGAATALIAATRGYSVCINYRHNHDAANRVVKNIIAAGGEAIAIAADVTSEPAVIQLFSQIDSELGSVTALVNNAGILEKKSSVEHMDAARIQRVLNTNILGPFLCTREAIRRMSTVNGGTGGAIVNVSSRAACRGAPNEQIDYAVSKGALDTFTIGLSLELANQGIRVNAVRPGIIDTEIHQSTGEPDRLKRLQSTVPMQRIGSPQEVANAILWLLSDEASYITGTFVDVSGGR